MSTTKKRILNYLLVEDNNAHAFIIKKCFQHGNHPGSISRVDCGIDCLRYLAGDGMFADRTQYPYPDVVLLDIRMPGRLDGLQTLQAIRADERYRTLPVMMLTTSDADVDVDRAYEMGANGYIVKSDDTGDMIEKLFRLRMSFDSLIRLPEEKPIDASQTEITE